MKYVLVTMLVAALLPAGCTIMINTATSEYFLDSCVAAQKSARLLDVDRICTRAMIGVDWSMQEPKKKSEQLYYLGRLKRQLYKYSEAIILFRESLAIEESMPKPSDLRIGKRLLELSLSLAGRDKWEYGLPYLERAIPVIPRFSGEERMFAAKVLDIYGGHFRKLGQVDVAGRFERTAAALYQNQVCQVNSPPCCC